MYTYDFQCIQILLWKYTYGFGSIRMELISINHRCLSHQFCRMHIPNFIARQHSKFKEPCAVAPFLPDPSLKRVWRMCVHTLTHIWTIQTYRHTNIHTYIPACLHAHILTYLHTYVYSLYVPIILHLEIHSYGSHSRPTQKPSCPQ